MNRRDWVVDGRSRREMALCLSSGLDVSHVADDGCISLDLSHSLSQLSRTGSVVRGGWLVVVGGHGWSWVAGIAGHGSLVL